MLLAKVSSKGQVTIPKAVRESLGIKQGDNILFVFEEGKIIVEKVDVVGFSLQERRL